MSTADEDMREDHVQDRAYPEIGRQQWDAWIAEHDARVRVAAIREAAYVLVDPVSAAWLRNYADRLEKERTS